MKSSENIWLRFLLDNIPWLLASLALAFGIWIVAVLQSDPVQQRTYSRSIPVTLRNMDNSMIQDGAASVDNVQVTLRAPRSVWDVLRIDQIRVFADLEGLGEGQHTVELQAELAPGIRGRVVDIAPGEVRVTLTQYASQRIPVEAQVLQEPPSGYAYIPPTCALTEVTASGIARRLNGLRAVARLNLSEDRNPVTRDINLIAIDTSGRTINDITLDPASVTCQVEISQREGVQELSVVPVVQGFPPTGYIYEGFDFTPRTVNVTGRQSAIRNMNGVIYTEPISLSGANSSFTRTVTLDLPENVRLSPESQTITVTISIGTVRGNRQYEAVPVMIEGLAPDYTAQILPDVVTVLVVGPQPLLQALTSDALRVSVDVEGLAPGSYSLPATASIIVENLTAGMTPDTTLTVQPAELNVTITNPATPTSAP